MWKGDGGLLQRGMGDDVPLVRFGNAASRDEAVTGMNTIAGKVDEVNISRELGCQPS